jgi:hypothetical protein
MLCVSNNMEPIWGEVFMTNRMKIWPVAALLFSAAPVSAQADVRVACMPDIRTFCAAELASFDRDKIRACLIENIKKTSPACQAAAKARRDAEPAKKEGE